MWQAIKSFFGFKKKKSILSKIVPVSIVPTVVAQFVCVHDYKIVGQGWVRLTSKPSFKLHNRGICNKCSKQEFIRIV